MYLSKLASSSDDYRTVHRDTKGKVKTTPYYLVQGDSTLETEHRWRYSNNALAEAKRRLVNMAVGYHSEQESHTCPSIQKREKVRSFDVIVAIDWSNIPLFSFFGKRGPLTYFPTYLLEALVICRSTELSTVDKNVNYFLRPRSRRSSILSDKNLFTGMFLSTKRSEYSRNI